MRMKIKLHAQIFSFTSIQHSFFLCRGRAGVSVQFIARKQHSLPLRRGRAGVGVDITREYCTSSPPSQPSPFVGKEPRQMVGRNVNIARKQHSLPLCRGRAGVGWILHVILHEHTPLPTFPLHGEGDTQMYQPSPFMRGRSHIKCD